MSTLSARHLTKSFKRRVIVRDVSLIINSGEIVGLLGPNGAGKTTSFYMLIGIIPCDQGTIYLNKTEISTLPMDKRARLGLGYLPQEASVFRKLTVEENILALLETRENLGRARAREHLEALLQEFHIAHLRGNTGMSLSGGERRRVEIARALATQPEFLLLDEPFAGIDPISILDIQKTARYLARRGIGVLITDHNVRETLGICDRAYIVIDGQIVKEGTPDAILEDERVRSLYLGEQFTL
jgi:lipopolysaccharide export system ATP-binding protein